MKFLSNIQCKKSNPQCLEIAIFGTDSAIGDEVMLLKPLFILKTLYPKCKISLLVQSSYAIRLFSYMDFIDEIILIHKDKSYLTRNFDILLFVIKHHSFEKLRQAAEIQAKRLITTFSKKLLFKKGLSYLFFHYGKKNRIEKVINPYWKQKHIIIEGSLNLVRSIDKKLYDSKIKDIDFTRARIVAGGENKIFVAKQLKSLGVGSYQKLIGISPFGKSSSRFGGNFSLQEWIEITQELAQFFRECGFIFLDYPKSGAAFGAFTQPNIKIFKNNEDLLNLVEFLNSLDLLLSVNTGIVHIADNLGIPTLEIIRKSESKKWAGGAYSAGGGGL